MSRRIFVNVRRGPMDNTAVCVFPWEIDLLQLIHMQEVEEVSIEKLSTQKEGVIKVEKVKLKHSEQHAPGIREQLEAMVYVDPEEDPANDPVAEYGRLAEKYGMDKDMPVPCVTRVFGELSSGAFAAKLKEHAKDRAPLPAHLRAEVPAKARKAA